MVLQLNIAGVLHILELHTLLLFYECIAYICHFSQLTLVVVYTLSLYLLYKYFDSWVPVDAFIRDEIKGCETFFRIVDFNLHLIRYVERKWYERKYKQEVAAEIAEIWSKEARLI